MEFPKRADKAWLALLGGIIAFVATYDTAAVVLDQRAKNNGIPMHYETLTGCVHRRSSERKKFKIAASLVTAMLLKHLVFPEWGSKYDPFNVASFLIRRVV